MLRSHGDISVTHPWGGTAGASSPTEPGEGAVPRQRVPVAEPPASNGELVAPIVEQHMEGSVATLATAAVPDLVASAASALPERGAFSEWLRCWGLHLEIGAAFLAGAAAAFTLDSRPHTALLALAVWLLGAYHTGRAVTTPLTGQFRSLAGSVTLPLSAVAAGVAFLGLSPVHISSTFGTLGAAAVASVLCRTVRWRWQAPVRVVVVGDRAAIASATTRWTYGSSVRLVGGLVIEEGLEAGEVPQEILGVRTAPGLEAAAAMVDECRADLVVVTQGSGMTPDAFRKLTWALEKSRVAIGVSGMLESVSPHRVTPGRLENVGVMDVRQPRPSTIVRGIKATADRALGVVFLMVAAPLLMILAAAIRLDSPGPALFKQVRIGRGGKPFTLYKLRTMVADAEETKADLREANEVDDVLFKMKRDPRITRLGSFLRRSSLDELPQLLNVVRGEMSLVGPRPFLPSEVAHMDDDALRRHVVQPGVTGLWQVSGRSDLAWGEAARLDTYYADNWSLSMDARIAARTVGAVLRGRGAY